jgi:outer membrane protein OmpA-like peptidoglycan-associated protein
MKIILLLVSFFICSVAPAQSISMKEKLADKYYNGYSYYKAIPMYEQLLKSTPKNYRIYEKLADSYRKINDSKNAERCFAFLVDTETPRHEYLLYYAQVLARNGRYEKAGIWYQKYGETEPADQRGKEFPALYNNLKTLLADSSSYNVTSAPFNSEASDFSPAWFGNEIVFVSARKKTSIIRSIYNRTSSSFLDLFVASPDSRTGKPFSGDLNTKYHEGPLTFTRNLDTVIFTRSNFFNKKFRKSTEGINKLKLFQAVWVKSQKRWTNITPLPFNNDQYSVGHPAFSPDGKTLYFASDMPGSLGGTDIYYSQLITGSNGKKDWSSPVNMGPEINTRGNEMFPFIDMDGNLWFSSDGLPGLGGLDEFVAFKKTGGFLKPVNPGYPLNTRFDDFGYITKSSGSEGYISSDRNNQIGNDDIYRIRKISRSLPVVVYDSKTKKRITSAAIVFSTGGTELQSQQSDVNGLGMFRIKPSGSYSISVTKENYDEAKLELSDLNSDTHDTIRIPMHPRSFKFILTGKVYSADNFKPVPNSTAYLTDKSDLSVKEAKCDEKGMFTFQLQPESDYSVKVSVSKKGSKCSSNINECSTRGLSTDVNFNQSFPVFCVGDVIKVENIYYDLGKYNIRPDAALELDKLLVIMKTYPSMKIELRSHTDSRGTASANMTLSQNRAKAAAEYLFSKGIERNRIASKGFGESMPLNNCIDGVKCTEEEYKVNRRTEFKILSIE